MSANYIKQAEAASHIREFLVQRGADIASRNIISDNNQRWVIFEHNHRQVGIDSDSAIWVRASVRDEWRCLARPSSVSSALQAVEFLIKTTQQEGNYEKRI